jgi:MFS family permease
MPYKWRVVAMLWWISFFNYADRQAIFSVFPLLEREMHLTTVQLGLLGSGFAWVYGLGAPFAGLVVDRVRRKTAILGGLHAWSLICMATVLSRNFRQLFLFRAAEGLGETFYFPASTSLISDYHSGDTRSRALGLHQTAVYMGTIGGAPFVIICGLTTSVGILIVALTLWGFFKGLYDANIFASVFDVVPPAARGRAAGFMNMIGWLAGGGSAPLVIGLVASRSSLGVAMALASVVYIAAGLLLVAGMLALNQRGVAGQQ